MTTTAAAEARAFLAAWDAKAAAGQRVEFLALSAGAKLTREHLRELLDERDVDTLAVSELLAVLERTDQRNRPKVLHEPIARTRERFADRIAALAAKRARPSAHRCGRCTRQFGLPNVTEYQGTGFCADCIDRCHESYDPFHQCVICAPKPEPADDGLAQVLADETRAAADEDERPY